MDANEAIELANIAFPNDTEKRGVYMLGLEKGYELCKAQMMKEAVEGRVFMSFAPGHNQMVMADVDLPTNTNVRVIILPKED